MKSEDIMLVAPCGINCRMCLAYMRKKNVCPGCRFITDPEAKTRVKCVIKNCEHVLTGGSGFCYDCEKLPCRRLKSLDKRYRTKYGMSEIENLAYIREHGIKAFVEKENKKWTCPECSAVLCIHRDNCLACGHKYR